MPTVSVVVPTYNRATLLRETIDSVLAQPYRDFEIVVVDDGSTDNTEEVVAALAGPIRYYRQDNRGRSVARNVGIRESRGRYLLFLDSDDLLLPRSLEALAGFLDVHPGVGVVYSDGWYCDAEGHNLERISLERPVIDEADPGEFIEYQALANVIVAIHSALVRRVWLDQIESPYFDESLTAGEDADFWLRLAVAGCTFHKVDELTCKYRLHPGGTYVADSPAFQLHRQSFIQSRLKVLYSDVFLKLSPQTQSAFLYGLLLDPVFGDVTYQDKVFASSRFGELALDVQSRILYLAAIDNLLRSGASTRARDQLARAVALRPHSLKYRGALWLAKSNERTLTTLVRARRRLHCKPAILHPSSATLIGRLARPADGSSTA